MLVRIRIQLHNQPGARFVHPMNPAPRTAVLAPGFRDGRMARVFRHGWNEHAERYRPQAIAARREELHRLTGRGLRLEHAVIVLTQEEEPGLSGMDRDLFWRAFGVPVFEQYLNKDNLLLAMECDAHAGLHVLRGCEHLALEREACVCGDRSPRVSRGTRLEELVRLLA
jgi:hypothetical protein